MSPIVHFRILGDDACLVFLKMRRINNDRLDRITMKNNDRRLLAEIEQDVLDNTKSLSGTLRKCIVLGGQAGSASLRDWATRELTGYKPDDELPDYRRVAAAIRIDAFTVTHKITGQRISPRVLPEAVRGKIKEQRSFHDGLGELEAIVAEHNGKATVKVSLPMGADIADLMDRAHDESDQKITDVYHDVAVASIRGIVDGVRTALAALVAELRAGMPDDQEIPSSGLADQAVKVVVHGARSRITVNSSQAMGHGKSAVNLGDEALDATPFWTRPRKVGVFIVGFMTIAGAIAAIVALLP